MCMSVCKLSAVIKNQIKPRSEACAGEEDCETGIELQQNKNIKYFRYQNV